MADTAAGLPVTLAPAAETARVSDVLTSRSDLPPDVLTFSAIIYNKGKRSKDSEVAEVTVELKDLASGEEVSPGTAASAAGVAGGGVAQTPALTWSIAV